MRGTVLEKEIYEVTVSAVRDSVIPKSKRRFVVPRRQVIAGAVAGAGAAVLGGLAQQDAYGLTLSKAFAKSHALAHLASPTSAMYIVAHPDDTLLFQSPDILQNVESDFRC
jgi:LmbE family N-acetylglucosaminyl deacetylase